MHVALVGQVLGRGEREARRDDALDCRVVGEVEEQSRALHGSALLEVLAKETRRLHVDAHGAEYNGEVVLVHVNRALSVLYERCLSADLRCHFVVGQAGTREERNFLAACHGVHDVDGGNARLDHSLGVISACGVNR